MLLRSSSASVIQSIFPDSPNRDFDNTKHPLSPDHSTTTKLLLTHGINNNHHQHHQQKLHSSSFCTDSSQIYQPTSSFAGFSPKIKTFRGKAFRRAHSDSNLQGLGLGSTSFDIEEFRCLKNLDKSLAIPNWPMLPTEPSFSIYISSDGPEEIEKNQDLEVENDRILKRSVTIGESIEALAGSWDFSFGKKSMGLIEEDDEEKEGLNGIQNSSIKEQNLEPVSPKMYLATGFGLGASGGGGSRSFDFNPVSFDEGGDVEEYYKRMIAQDPFNPLFLRNYAQLLLSKRDLLGAEEYYFHAMLADPQDGEILMQYAKLIWELYRDRDRALSYFERAAKAVPEDSRVLAAYACFLWELEEDEAEDNAEIHVQTEEDEGVVKHEKALEGEERPASPPLHLATGLGIEPADLGGGVEYAGYNAEGSGEVGNIEDCYKQRIAENPSNPLVLRNYAQFLHENKGDIPGAEEYYSRAILADPGDGEIMKQYALLVWEVHHDQAKASSYFERAVQATPEDCHVLASYAKFLWETEEDEEENRASQVR